jgi:hypothetical protein
MIVKKIKLFEDKSNYIECYCGWSWDIKDSEDFDKYVCHKCGADLESKYIIEKNVAKDKELPFKEKILSDNIFIREFKQENDSDDYKWHRDKEDRIIENTEPTDWLIQLDDELPQKIKGEIFIPNGVYHRLIKGTGDLIIKLTKLK